MTDATTADEAKRVTAREINETIRYTVWTVFARSGGLDADPDVAAKELQGWADALAEQDIVLRGAYDVSGLRDNADLMLWLHGPTAEGLQHALRDFRRTAAGASTSMVWSGMAMHRPAEFNRGHVPAFMSGKDPLDWLCVYPFVRSYEWYLLPEDERRRMLTEHGMKGRDYTEVQSNTVASFALGDYEWVLALESPVLHDLVDMMRDMRYTDARRHVREEIPFYTGRRIPITGAADVIR
ncbi:MAG: hydrogen peroxide-dependent heme synthase [Actinomycetes bacterium]